MRIGVPSEVKRDEYRVAMTPAGVRELTERGHEVVVQAGAGVGSAIADADYVAQGAAIAADAAGGLRRRGDDRQGEGAAAARGGDAGAAPHPLHLPPPRPRRRS